jgi:putative aldouronate transport system substrate-binding protein
MKSISKVLAASLAALMLVSPLTACKKADTNVSNESTGSTEIKPVTLKVFMSDPSYQAKNYGSDPQSKAIIAKTGVTLDIEIPASNGDEKAQLMLASGDYPDMMWINSGSTFEKYVAGNAIQPIDTLAKKYGYYDDIFGDAIPTSVWKYWLRSGHYYGVPNWTSEDGFGAVGEAFNLRNDIYEKLGSPVFATMDDFYNYLVSVSKANLKQNGQSVFPFGINYGSGRDILNNIATMANVWGSQDYYMKSLDSANNKVKFLLEDPNVLKAVKFLNKLYVNGLMPSDVITMDSNKRSEAFSTGVYACWLTSFWDLWTANSVLSTQDKSVYYKAVTTPEGTAGTKANLGGYNRIGTVLITVTSKCKDTAAAMRFINFELSKEGQMLDFWGTEGETYTVENGQAKFKDGVYEAKLADWWGYGAKTGIRYWDFIPTQKYNYERTVEASDKKANRAVAQAAGWDAAPLISIYIDSTTDAGIANSDIEGALPDELTKIILTKDSSKVDSMYNTLLSKMKQLGSDKLDTAWTEYYLKQLKATS